MASFKYLVTLQNVLVEGQLSSFKYLVTLQDVLVEGQLQPPSSTW